MVRDLAKSTFSFLGALSLYGARAAGQLLAAVGSPRSRAELAASLDEVTGAARRQLGSELDELFATGDRLQRGAIDAVTGGAPDTAQAHASTPGREAAGTPAAPERPARRGAAAEPAPRNPAESGRLDTSRFVVLGEGLAAGMADFALHADWQRTSFPAQMAASMGVELPQALLAAPGLGDAPGFARLPVRLPAALQGAVLERMPPRAPFRNLAVPGLTLEDALELRPAPPLVHRDDAKRTMLNLLLGLPQLAGGDPGPAPTAVEAALACRPSFALVALGYAEVLGAAVAGDPGALPAAGGFGDRYGRLLARLRESGAEVLATTVPDPLDTAYFSTLGEAAEVLRIAPADLTEGWGVAADDRLTVPGLAAIGFQVHAGARQPLAQGEVLTASVARAVAERVREVNAAVAEIARRHAVPVFDLAALVRSLAERGLDVGGRRLGAGFLGGLYSLDGAFPGATGQAVIAHEVLAFLNARYGARFPGIDLAAVAAGDPAAGCRPATGPWLAREALPAAAPPPPAPPPPRPARSPQATGDLVATKEAPPGPLRLPPGRVQTLPLARRASYFGDGIRPVHCHDEREVGYGSCGNLLFGGLALVDSHLTGEITVRFAEPVDGVSRFEIDFGAGFVGEDAVLATPQFFRMPFHGNRVDPVPGTVSSGDLDLATGLVTNLTVYASYRSGALGLLVAVNPTFPRQPLSFPGQYGSSWARFEQRPDGLLDLTFYGSTFVPLGPGILWPLNFAGADGQPATIPAAGTSMHPHLALSTKEQEVPWADPPELPENTIRELTLLTHNSSFGDKFDLDTPELGGEAMGRSHLLGRLEVQFGERTGGSLPFAVTALGPGGLLAELPDSPLTEVFPGRLYQGPMGFNELLRFPLRSYYLDGVYILDDPFDLSIGLVDLATGWAHGEMLHRGFIGQNVIFALLRVEPRTPKDSFFFRGPALFERGPAGGTVFRFKGEVYVPYPAGFLFPRPDLASGLVVEGWSKLDPYYWLHAVEGGGTEGGMEGGEEGVTSSTGERFSYSYRLPAGTAGEPARFEYVNDSQKGRFRLESLTWIDFAAARGQGPRPDSVTFAGFGTWTKDGVDSRQQVAVQVSTAAGARYVGIQVGGGLVSNVNLKPVDARDARP